MKQWLRLVFIEFFILALSLSICVFDSFENHARAILISDSLSIVAATAAAAAVAVKID